MNHSTICYFVGMAIGVAGTLMFMFIWAYTSNKKAAAKYNTELQEFNERIKESLNNAYRAGVNEAFTAMQKGLGQGAVNMKFYPANGQGENSAGK